MTGWASFFHPYEVVWHGVPRDKAIRGDWWRPDQPGTPVRGTLTIPRFGNPQIHFEGGDELLTLPFGPFDILHGSVWDIGNSAATVFGSFAAQGGTTYAPGTSEPRHHRTVDITVNRLLVGRHLSSDTEGAITCVSLVSPYLNAWAQFDGFSDGPMPPDQLDYELKFTPQETEHVRVSESTSVHFRCVMHRAGALAGP
jgi:ApeA N-terminal domain 1